jgi:cell division protein FtsQ
MKTTTRTSKAKPVKTRKAPPRRSIGKWLVTHRRRVMWTCLVSATLGVLTGAVIWTIRNDVPQRLLAAIDQTVLQGMQKAGLIVDDVVVVGRVETSRKDIAMALNVRRGDAILGVDIEAARQNLEKLGWVQSATITRRLPGDLHVHLKERRPFALWQKKGRLVLIDRDGVAITARRLERFRALPVVVGRSAPQHVGALFDALARQPELFSRVVAAVRIADRRWDIRFNNDIVARLPEDSVSAGWSRLAALEAKHKILARDLEAIDLRLEDRLIVRLSARAAERRRQPGNNT